MKVKKLFEECLGLKDIKIERAHRAGFRGKNKSRTIVLKLLDYKDKVEILKKSVMLKGKNIYINEDFGAETNKIRKTLREEMKVARQSGKFAFITYDTLVIRDWKEKEINYAGDVKTTHGDKFHPPPGPLCIGFTSIGIYHMIPHI
ncbi:uncharacterized protein LOC136091738 [Hydra vulgaris]|uniref:Uncharacterized protein LOC136091738 n=1 Tax=Hydra vulgaris TaxID=6087 RepID=A0ABM4DLV6_HYDVU